MDPATQFAVAYALSTSAGVRGLLTLAAASVAVHAGWLHPIAGFAWLGETPVTIGLLAVALVDLVADKIPFVDHALHVVHAVVKPACAASLGGGTLHVHSTFELGALMALGALNALGVHAASASVRGASTAATGGVANPFVSALEDALAIVLSALAFFAPFVGAACALALVALALLALSRIWRGGSVTG